MDLKELDREEKGESNIDVSVTQALGKMHQFFMPGGEHASEIAFSRSMFVLFFLMELFSY